MGDRYFLNFDCPNCGNKNKDIYYAPTCGIKTHKCNFCGFIINLEEISGISEEEASNADIIKNIVDFFASKNSS